MYCAILELSCFFCLMIRRPPRSTRTDTSFPTRRSSDLGYARRELTACGVVLRRVVDRHVVRRCGGTVEGDDVLNRADGLGVTQYQQPYRSEEHTSELQSLMRISYAVFCLKKKKH